MLTPSIDSLQEKIKSKYVIVTIAARRARALQGGEKPIIENKENHKFVGVALEEINQGKLFVKKTEEK